MSSVDWTSASSSPSPTPPANMSSLAFLLDVFNADRLTGVWEEQAGAITEQCHQDMTEFFAARKRAHIWALKSESIYPPSPRHGPSLRPSHCRVATRRARARGIYCPSRSLLPPA
ncbi:hypothetical protein ONE63_003743 [Megalurothrips usitatus]|uniref:Uncharacterized protein n=1 Tax=Megalurothrips usitatus TaxID=439358 RepID=A0AAV7XAX6_9NEOP|nr:hypothetical protein ONE63_003743 [Megalurothrips usitatus]